MEPLEPGLLNLEDDPVGASAEGGARHWPWTHRWPEGVRQQVMAAGSRSRGSCICRYTLCAVRKRPPSGLQPSVCRWPVTIRHRPSTCTTSSSGLKPWAFIFIWKSFSAWTLSRAAAALSLSSCTGSTATWFFWARAVLGHRDATWLPLGSPLPTRFIRVSNCRPRARGSECSTWCSCRVGTQKRRDLPYPARFHSCSAALISFRFRRVRGQLCTSYLHGSGYRPPQRTRCCFYHGSCPLFGPLPTTVREANWICQRSWTA